MKIDTTEVAPSGKTRIKVWLGKRELQVIEQMASNGLQHTPKNKDTEKTRQSMKGILLTSRKALIELQGCDME